MMVLQQEDNGKNIEALCQKIKLQERQGQPKSPKKKKHVSKIKRKPALDSHNTEISYITFRKKDFIRENIDMVQQTYARLMPMVQYILKKYTKNTKINMVKTPHSFLKKAQKHEVQEEFHIFMRQCCSNPHYYRLLKNYTEELKAEGSHMNKQDMIQLITNFSKDFKKKCHQEVKTAKKPQKKQWQPLRFQPHSHVSPPIQCSKRKQRSLKTIKSTSSKKPQIAQSFDQVVQILRDVMPSLKSDLDDLKSVSLKPQFLTSLGFRSAEQIKEVMDTLDQNMQVITALSTVCNIPKTSTEELVKQRSRVSKLVRLKTSYLKKVVNKVQQEVYGDQVDQGPQGLDNMGQDEEQEHSVYQQNKENLQGSKVPKLIKTKPKSKNNHQNEQILEIASNQVERLNKRIKHQGISQRHQNMQSEIASNYHKPFPKPKIKLKKPQKARKSIKESQDNCILVLESSPVHLSAKTTAGETPQQARRSSSVFFPKINNTQTNQQNQAADSQNNQNQQFEDSIRNRRQSSKSNRSRKSSLRSSIRNSQMGQVSHIGQPIMKKMHRPSILSPTIEEQNNIPFQQASRFKTARPSITIHEQQLPLSSNREIKARRPSTINSPRRRPIQSIMTSVLTSKATVGSEISQVKIEKKHKMSDKFQLSSSCAVLPTKIPEFNKLSINIRHNFVENRLKIVQECQRMQQFLKSIKHSQNFDVFVKRAENNKLGTERRIPTSMHLKSRKQIIHQEEESLNKKKLKKFKEYQEAVYAFRKQYATVEKSQQKIKKLNFFVKLFKLSLIKHRTVDEDQNIDIFLHQIITKTIEPQFKDYLSMQKFEKGHIHKKRAAFEKALLDFSQSIRQLQQQALIGQKEPSNKLIFYFNQ